MLDDRDCGIVRANKRAKKTVDQSRCRSGNCRGISRENYNPKYIEDDEEKAGQKEQQVNIFPSVGMFVVVWVVINVKLYLCTRYSILTKYSSQERNESLALKLINNIIYI